MEQNENSKNLKKKIEIQKLERVPKFARHSWRETRTDQVHFRQNQIYTTGHHGSETTWAENDLEIMVGHKLDTAKYPSGMCRQHRGGLSCCTVSSSGCSNLRTGETNRTNGSEQHTLLGRLGEQGLVSLSGTKPGWLDKLREIPMCGRIARGESVTMRVHDSVEGQKDKMKNNSCLCC